MKAGTIICAWIVACLVCSPVSGQLPEKAAPANVIHALTVTSHLPESRSDCPVSWSVPLGIDDNVLDAAGLSLYRNNTEIPAQFTPLARWGGTPDETSAPIAWLLVDCQLDLESNESAILYLAADSPSVPGSPLTIIRNDSTGITIETGAATYDLSKTAFRLFDSVTLSDETVFSGSGGISLSGAITPYPAEISVEHQGAQPDFPLGGRIGFFIAGLHCPYPVLSWSVRSSNRFPAGKPGCTHRSGRPAPVQRLRLARFGEF